MTESLSGISTNITGQELQSSLIILVKFVFNSLCCLNFHTVSILLTYMSRINVSKRANALKMASSA